MPLNTIIKKLENGNVEIDNGTELYSLNGDLQVVKKEGLVLIRHKSGSIIDTFLSEDIIKVIRVDGTEIPIAGNTLLLFTELSRYFFFKLASGSGTGITVVTNYAALPSAASVPGQFYWAENSQGTKWIGSLWGGNYYPRGMYYSNGVDWTFHEVPFQATIAQVNNGINNSEFVTPYTFANSDKIVNSFQKNIDDSDDITEGAVNLFMTQAERDKLNNQFAYIWAVNTLNSCK